MSSYQAAVALIRCDNAVLLMRRSERDDDPWSGHWALPGGRRETDDADAIATAARETSEEMGVSLIPGAGQLLGVNIAGAHVGRRIDVAVCSWTLGSRPGLTLDPREAAGAQWLDLDWFQKEPRESKELVPGKPKLPCLIIQGHPLWGFTLRILESVLRPKPHSDDPVLP